MNLEKGTKRVENFNGVLNNTKQVILFFCGSRNASRRCEISFGFTLDEVTTFGYLSSRLDTYRNFAVL